MIEHLRDFCFIMRPKSFANKIKHNYIFILALVKPFTNQLVVIAMQQTGSKKYQYIIAGGGMAGLSLAFYLNQSLLRDKSILIIDRDPKNTNDHTWCFWEKTDSAFQNVVFKQWNGVWFHGSGGFSEFLNLEEYYYKMIRGLDFYQYVFAILKQNPNITFLQTEINGITNVGDDTVVKTNQGDFVATEFVFDSFYRSMYNNPKNHNMLQHFKGWVIETQKTVFNERQPTLFDFRVNQKDECRFVYVLPYSTTKALIEFTVFSDNLLEQHEYDDYLKKYITQTLQIGEYQIIENEFGIVPMSDELQLISPSPKVIRIGTSGGYVKTSTGYSFQRTQRLLKQLVDDLIVGNAHNYHNNTAAMATFKTSKWKLFLDSILLNVMLKKRTPSDDIFTKLFAKNRPADVLNFLDEDSTFWEDIKLTLSVPTLPFTKAAVEVLFKKVIK